MSGRWLRRIYLLHRLVGRLASALILLLTLSGTLLVFREELENRFVPGRTVRPLPTRLALDAVEQALQQHYPQHRVTGFQLGQHSEQATIAYLGAINEGKFISLYVDQYRGTVQGEVLKQATLQVIYDVHANFYASSFWGRVGVGIFGLILCFSGFTGAFIYRKFMRAVWQQGKSWYQLRAPLRFRLADSHKMIGIVVLLLQLVVGLTGAVLGVASLLRYSPAARAALQSTPQPNRQAGERRITSEQALALARQSLPLLQPTAVLLPSPTNRNYTIYGDLVGVLARQSVSFVTVDGQTGAVPEVSHALMASGWRRCYDWIEPLHYGNFGGWSIKLLYFLGGLAMSWLPVSGLWLRWSKRARPVKRS